MAHTPAQRDRHALCGARKANGEPCRAFAGQGTNHFGIGRCRRHGGSTKNHIKHAAKVEAQRALAELQATRPTPVEPGAALLEALSLAVEYRRWIGDELASIKDRDNLKAQVLLRQFGEQLDRIARLAKAALDAGLPERHHALASFYGAQIASVLGGIFNELDLTEEQRECLPELTRRHLSKLEGRELLTRDRAARERA